MIAKFSSNAFEKLAQSPPRWVRILIYSFLLIGFLAADHNATLRLFFPLAFSVPVLVATWWDGRIGGYTLAALSMIRWISVHPIPDLLVHAGALVLLVELISRTVALAKRVRLLEGLLPICSFCHRIRNQEKRWIRLEQFIHERADVIFSHGFCPSCLETNYGFKKEEPAKPMNVR